MSVFPSNVDEYHPSGLQRPRFTLKTLFVALTFVAILLGTYKVAGPMHAAVLILMAITILAHVAGNVVGTQLRDSTDQARAFYHSESTAQAEPHHFAQTTRLAQRVKPRWPMMALTGCCAVAGSYGGGRFLAEVNAAQATTANLALAYGSCGVLAAILGFGLSMFLKVAFEAWWQASFPPTDRSTKKMLQTRTSRNLQPHRASPENNPKNRVHR